jgi:hypothetical protein
VDALDRLKAGYLSRAESDLESLRKAPRVTTRSDYRDVRAVVHCHTHLSHDSTGRIDEMADAAAKTGTEVVMVNDHPRTDLDVFSEGFSGENSGVLFIPGAEARNLLIYAAEGLDFTVSQRKLVPEIARRGGICFLSHLENQREWDLQGLTGTEIYNLHASFLAQKRLSGLFRPSSRADISRLVDVLLRLRDHPHTGFASLCEVPSYYLSCWEKLCRSYTLTGLAANDSHANNTIIIKRSGGDLSIRDPVGSEIARVPLTSGISSEVPDGELVLTPDNYEVSFHHVGTHLLPEKRGLEGVIDCLRNGRCYVGFDWIVDPSGFSFTWEAGGDFGHMGGSIGLEEKPVLLAYLPLPAEIELFRNGQIVDRNRSASLEYRPDAPGLYRVEAYLEVAGEKRPWILSNPIRVTGESRP